MRTVKEREGPDNMHIVVRNELDDDQSRVFMGAYDVAWRRITEADLLTPAQHAHAQNILCGHLLWLIERGERKPDRLASRGVFLICGLLACPDCTYVPGRPLMTDGAQILF
jgi:hypothetical protein